MAIAPDLVDGLASNLNTSFQNEPSALYAYDLLLANPPSVLRALADLNHVELKHENPRKETVVLALVNDRFELTARKRGDLA